MSASAGAASPEAYVLLVRMPQDSSGAYLEDGRDATSAYLERESPSGSTIQWSVTIEGASEAALTLRHVFAADASDIPTRGDYKIRVFVTSPSGVRRGRTTLPVKDF